MGKNCGLTLGSLFDGSGGFPLGSLRCGITPKWASEAVSYTHLDVYKRQDVETVKSFVTRTDDKFRQSYGVAVESHPRSCIIVGSTNSE